MKKEARSYKDIMKDCLENRNNTKIFNGFFKELTKNVEFNNKIWRPLGNERGDIFFKLQEIPEENFSACCNNISYLKKCLVEEIKKNSFKTEEEQNKIRINKNEKQWKKRHKDEIEKNNELEYMPRGPVQKIVSADEQKDGFSNSVLDNISGYDDTELSAENNELNEFLQDLTNKGIYDELERQIFIAIFNYENLDEIRNLSELVRALGFKETFNMEIKHAIKTHYSKIPKIKTKLRQIFSFSIYESIISYLIDNQNKKLKIPELIIDFNKVRNYLSILLMNKDIKNKSSFVRHSSSSLSSCEKEIHRILSLFKCDNIAELQENIKIYSAKQIAKIYDTHTVPNLVSNFLILDAMKQEGSNNIKLKNLINLLFPDKYIKNAQNKKDIKNFRKYNLLPRLKELEEYGFIKIGNDNDKNKDKYSLTAKFLTDQQKNSLKYVVPFFCGFYPFSSVGHFLANRLDIKDIFRFEAFNIANILDDCITFDLLTAINHNDTIIINFKNKDQRDKKIVPKELLIDKKDLLLKVVDDNQREYYLNEIDKINNKKPNNLIFSEIYSFYYKIFEEKINNPSYDIDEIIKKYGTTDTSDKYKNNYKLIKELMPKLEKLKNATIPLTKLEIRWLKTIMQDERFDLFVDDDKKQSLEDLVEGVEPFDLTSFKVYSAKEKKYKSIKDFCMPEGLNKNTFREQIKELNSILFNIEKNSFPELAKTHHK